MRSAKTITIVTLTVLIFTFSAYGFGSKLYEFFMTAIHFREGRFALTPIINYLLVAGGFLMLLVWAIFTGMFHNIEAPKYTMLEQEEKLDRLHHT